MKKIINKTISAMSKGISISISAFLFTGINSVYAGTVTASPKTTATISSTCNLSVTNISFGNYNPAGGDVSTQGSINLLCTKGTSVSIGMERNPGVDTVNCPNYSLSFCYANGVRYMSDSASHALYYEIFASNNFSTSTVIPGPGWFTGNSYITTKATGATQSISFWGALSGNQWVNPGNYSDTVTAIVTY
jgi:spore coat protein U-like protein